LENLTSANLNNNENTQISVYIRRDKNMQLWTKGKEEGKKKNYFHTKEMMKKPGN
jgi:phosphoribosyl-AMP cyclohydrolase